MDRMSWETDEEWNKRWQEFYMHGRYTPPPKREGRPDLPMAHLIEIRNETGAVTERVRVENAEDIPKALEQLQASFRDAESKRAKARLRHEIRGRVGAAHKMVGYSQHDIYERLKQQGMEPTLAWVMSNAPGDLIRLYEDLDPKLKTDYRAVTGEVV